MPEKAGEFKKRLDSIAAEANAAGVKESLTLIEAKMNERARAGKYDLRVGVRREYLPRISEAFEAWELEAKVTGTFVLANVVFVDIFVQWHNHNEPEKPLGFGQSSN